MNQLGEHLVEEECLVECQQLLVLLVQGQQHQLEFPLVHLLPMHLLQYSMLQHHCQFQLVLLSQYQEYETQE